jgi:hypothetical protein
MTKVYRAYVGYGRHPLVDKSILNNVKQARDKGKGKPVNKLYTKERKARECVRPVGSLAMFLMRKNFTGTTEEFIKVCKDLKID